MNRSSKTQLRIFFQDDGSPEFNIPIPLYGGEEFYSLGNDQEVVLPNGEVLKVYVEVSLAMQPNNILLTIQEGEKSLDVRCGEFVVVGYQTNKNLYVLFQIGTGTWEEGN